MRFTVVPKQTTVGPLIDTVGFGFTAIVVFAVAVHPFVVPISNTLKGEVGLTEMVEVVALVFHK